MLERTDYQVSSEKAVAVLEFFLSPHYGERVEGCHLSPLEGYKGLGPESHPRK